MAAVLLGRPGHQAALPGGLHGGRHHPHPGGRRGSIVDQLAGVKDWRGLLPTRYRALPYDKRDVKGITYVVVHHSAGPASWSANAGGGGNGLAGWDVTQTDRDPYPEITYHFVVNYNGQIERCLNLDALAWHSGARGLPSPGGVGINNWKGVAICLPGNFMGAIEPPDRPARGHGQALPGPPQAAARAPRWSATGTSCLPAAPRAPATPGRRAAGGGWRDKLLTLIGDTQRGTARLSPTT